MYRGRALLLYLALSVPFGIAVHVCSEFAGLGRDADEVAFSALHAYLLAIAAGALVTFLIAAGFFASPAERRRRIGLMSAALPYRGQGVRFFALSATLQFGFFLVTQLGEGCPLCKGDFLVGLLAAAVSSAIGALAVQVLRRHVVRAIVTFSFRDRSGRLCGDRRVPRYAILAAKPTYASFAPTLGSRPPPLLL